MYMCVCVKTRWQTSIPSSLTSIPTTSLASSALGPLMETESSTTLQQLKKSQLKKKKKVCPDEASQFSAPPHHYDVPGDALHPRLGGGQLVEVEEGVARHHLIVGRQHWVSQMCELKVLNVILLFTAYFKTYCPRGLLQIKSIF